MAKISQTSIENLPNIFQAVARKILENIFFRFCPNRCYFLPLVFIQIAPEFSDNFLKFFQTFHQEHFVLNLQIICFI